MAQSNAARKLEALPQQRRFTAREMLALAKSKIDMSALAEADAEYGNDFARELADIKAGKHPTQRPKNTK